MKRSIFVAALVVFTIAAFAEPVPLFSVALDEVHARTDASLKGYFIVTLAVRDCASQREDGDLGPFIRSAEKAGDEYLVIFIAPDIKQPSFAVFFRQDHAIAFAENMHGAEPRRVSIEKPAAATQKSLKLEKVDLLADDGTKIKALHILEE